MGLGEIFSATIEDIRANFKSTSKIVFFFYIIPAAIASIISTYWLFGTGLYDSLVALQSAAQENIFEMFKTMGGFILGTSLLSFIASLIGLIAIVGILVVSIKKKKFSYSEALKSVKSNYWPFIGLVAVMSIFLLGLSILLIIPALVFAIYWVFAPYVMFNENTKVVESLRRSFKLVRGRWWKTLGYLFVLGVLLIVVSFIFSIPGMIFSGGISVSAALGSGSPSTTLLIISQIISLICNSISYLVTLPAGIFFLKNFYLELKASNKKRD